MKPVRQSIAYSTKLMLSFAVTQMHADTISYTHTSLITPAYKYNKYNTCRPITYCKCNVLVIYRLHTPCTHTDSHLVNLALTLLFSLIIAIDDSLLHNLSHL